MSLLRVALVLFAFFGFSGSAAAESVAPLTSKNIQGFLDSMPEFQKLGEKYGKDEQQTRQDVEAMQKKYAKMAQSGQMMGPSKQQMERAASPFTSSLKEIRASEGYGEMLSTVKRHGFSSVEQWASVGDRAMRAYAANKMSSEMPKANAKMQEMRANLARSGMSEQQQKAMLDMMDSSSQALKTFEDVPAADKKAIKPFMKRFDELADSQQGRR